MCSSLSALLMHHAKGVVHWLTSCQCQSTPAANVGIGASPLQISTMHELWWLCNSHLQWCVQLLVHCLAMHLPK